METITVDWKRAVHVYFEALLHVFAPKARPEGMSGLTAFRRLVAIHDVLIPKERLSGVVRRTNFVWHGSEWHLRTESATKALLEEMERTLHMCHGGVIKTIERNFERRVRLMAIDGKRIPSEVETNLPDVEPSMFVMFLRAGDLPTAIMRDIPNRYWTIHEHEDPDTIAVLRTAGKHGGLLDLRVSVKAVSLTYSYINRHGEEDALRFQYEPTKERPDSEATNYGILMAAFYGRVSEFAAKERSYTSNFSTLKKMG